MEKRITSVYVESIKPRSGHLDSIALNTSTALFIICCKTIEFCTHEEWSFKLLGNVGIQNFDSATAVK
jgi:hypothetical protein